MVTKMIKKLYLYAHSAQKWVYIEDIFIIKFILLNKYWKIDKYSEIWEKFSYFTKSKYYVKGAKKLTQKNAFVVFVNK